MNLVIFGLIWSVIKLPFLPPATKLGQRDIFRSVCQEFCSQGWGGIPACIAGGIPACLQASRPTHMGEVEESGLGVSRPTPGEGLQAHTQAVSRPTPRGIPACTEADPSTKWLLLWVLRILMECILV